MNRREFITGTAAAVAATSLPLAFSREAEAAASVTAQWRPVKTFWLQYRICMTPAYSPSYREGEQVQIQFKKGAQDRRKFGCGSLERASGQVKLAIPAGAMPWRYIGARLPSAPAKFKSGLRKHKEFARRYSGPRYLVGTSKGYVIVNAQRMRQFGGVKLSPGSAAYS